LQAAVFAARVKLPKPVAPALAALALRRPRVDLVDRPRPLPRGRPRGLPEPAFFERDLDLALAFDLGFFFELSCSLSLPSSESDALQTQNSVILRASEFQAYTFLLTAFFGLSLLEGFFAGESYVCPSDSGVIVPSA